MIQKLNKNLVNNVVDVLKSGGIVVSPTDTVYGFLADASNKKAVAKIYKIKKRTKSKFLPVFVKDLKMVKELAEIDEEQEKTLKKYWPGKYTFVLKRKKRLKLYDGAKNTIALRIPKYKFLNDLLKRIDKPLVQTSVNISGQPALTKIKEVQKQFDRSNILIIDSGNFKKSKASKVVDLTGDKIKVIRK